MRNLILHVAASVAVACLLCACDPNTAESPPPARFASIKKEASQAAATSFCEKQWPAAPTPGARRLLEIPERALPGGARTSASKGGGWKWVNLWATWCLPCLEEMRILGRWQSSLAKDGIPLDLELWSVDEDEAKLADYVQKTTLPGHLRWLRAPADLEAVLEGLGADATAGIPVHALVDGHGNLRCLRVGAVHDEDYGAVKSLLSIR